MPQLFNRVGVASSTSGTGTVTLGSALGAVAVNTASWQSFSGAGIPDPTVVSYLILDSNGAWEVGTGTFTAGTLSRNVKSSSNSNALISLSGTEQVFVTALASDGGDVLGGTTTPLRGFDTPVNLSLTSSVNASLLTINIVANNGANPTPTNPVFMPFRDPNSALGDPVWRSITAATSITTAIGATQGTSANTAFRLWVCAFDNSGTVVLALINCSTPTQIFPLTETLMASTINMSGSSTSAGVFYTPSGITLASRPFRVIGFVEYNSTGLSTPGSYSRVPDFMQLMGAGMKRPGDVVQTSYVFNGGGSSTASTSFVDVTGATVSITPTSAANRMRYNFSFSTQITNVVGTNTQGTIQGLAGANVLSGPSIGAPSSSGGIGSIGGGAICGLDSQNTTSPTVYKLQQKSSIGTATSSCSSIGIQVDEIMG